MMSWQDLHNKGENEMLNPTLKQIERMEETLSDEFEMKISNLAYHHDGISFTVETELEAYKAAYKYQFRPEVIVKEATNIEAWLVQVYT